MAERLAVTGPLERFGEPGARSVGFRFLSILLVGLAYVGAAKAPIPSGLPFQAYLFWPAAAVAHSAFFIVGKDAAAGLALGALLLNQIGRLPWPYALAMSALQVLEPYVAWRIQVRLGGAHPDPGHSRDLLRWFGVAAGAAFFFSATLGSTVVGFARHVGFRNPLTTAFSWFLGDLTALICLGPALLFLFASRPASPRPSLRRSHPVLEVLILAGLFLFLLFGARISPGLSPDVGLALHFTLILPALWMALRLGPRATAMGIALLSMAVLAHLLLQGKGLPEAAFRFSQLHLLVLALATLVTAAAAEEARTARHALELKELQAQRMEAVATLAGGLVHGFNNQLTVLLGNLDRLRKHLAPAMEGDAMAQRVEDAALAMESTVRQLKALSHQAPLRTFSLPLREALGPFLEEAAHLPEGVAFEADFGENPLVGLDPDLLRQALHPLLTNSREALDGAGRIRLRTLRRKGWIHLVLEDDGPGMAPEVLRQALDPYYSTKSSGQGHGLGLPIAFSLAKQMGGWLSLDSRPDEGTRAELRLPLGQAPKARLEPISSAPRTRRVLLADDEAGIRELTREILETQGYSVVEAADGAEALEAFESDPANWDLAVLDLVMPRLHGSEVLAHIQAIRPDLPAVLMSGYSAQARPDLLEGPHRRFLAKPFRIREMIEALQALGLNEARDGE
ncbi:ATP-binding protein [Geothrix sp. 21YS21S-4]|uniref:ATP-binding protein n=1 Tax=Geothrix sp. 21YS21S-4 TaxID=3068889 RepID=UPI0027B8981E|nr:ATP-binding protein [Geothrix sp. 21YS21S-4]